MIKELLKEKRDLQETIDSAKWYILNTSPTDDELLIHKEMIYDAVCRINGIDYEIAVIEMRDKKIDYILKR